MRTIEKTVYNFHELEKSIQEKVISEWRYNDHFHDGDDIIKAAEKLADLIGARLDYSLGGQGSYCKFKIEIDDSNFKAKDFFPCLDWMKMLETAGLSGLWVDWDLINPIIIGLENDSTTLPVIEAIEKAIVKVYNNQLDYWYSEKSIVEEIEINDYEFYENGKLV
jgi:hypothetical protein